MIGNGIFFMVRNIKKSRRTYALEFLIVLMVSILLFAVCVLEISKAASELRVAKGNGKEHAIFEGEVLSLSDQMRSENGIKHYNRFIEKYGVITVNSRTNVIRTEWFENINDLPLTLEIRGNLPSNENEALLSEENRFNLGTVLEIGDRITFIDDEEKEQQFVITGFYSVPYREGFSDVLRLISNGKDLQGFTHAAVEFKSEFGIQKKCDAISGLIGSNVYYMNNRRISVFFQSEDGFNYESLFFYIILAVVLLLVAMTMLKSAFAVRKHKVYKEYAIMRSIGATSKTLYMICFTEGLVMGVTGGIAGSVISYFVVKVGFFIADYDLTETSSFRIEGVVAAFIITLVAVTLICILTKLRFTGNIVNSTIYELLVSKKKIRIKNREGKVYRNPIVAYIKTSLKRKKGRVIICIASFAGSILMFVMYSGLQKDFASLYGNDSNATYYEVNVVLNAGYSATKSTDELVRIIEDVKGVMATEVNPIYFGAYSNIDNNFKSAGYNNCYTVKDGRYEQLAVCVYNAEELKSLKKNLISGTTDIGNDECILVNKAIYYNDDGMADYTQKYKVTELDVNDMISIRNVAEIEEIRTKMVLDGGYDKDKLKEYIASLDESHNLNLKISGTVTSDLYGKYGYAPVLILSKQYYNSLVKNDIAEKASIKVKIGEGFELNHLREKCLMYSEFGDVDYCDIYASISHSMASMSGVSYGEILVIALVGVINIFCVVMLDWEIQRNEYAILRSVGASRADVLKVIIAEKGYIGLLSVLLGGAGGIALEKVLIRLSFSEKISFTLPYKELLAVVCAMILVVGVTVRIQSGLIKNMNIADVLKQTEE